MKSTNQFNRRTMIAAGAAAAAITIVPRHVLGAGQTPPSEKLNVAAIGLGGIGTVDVHNMTTENVVALCDVDQEAVARNAKDFPKAKHHTDYRKMFDTQKDIDAVLVAVPDHGHTVIALTAMKLGKHVHCQKPLTHSVYEARLMAKVAKETKVATQMGNFGQASEEARLVSEYIWSGAIGTVREIHAGSNRQPAITRRGIPRPEGSAPVPANLDWDLWLGPAPARPFYPHVYHPFAWRSWWDFGTGVLGDIGCHQLSAVFKALKLGHPQWIEACSSNHQCGPEIANESAPVSSIIRWHFAAEGDRAAVDITWWDGGMKPPRPEELEPGRKFAEDDWVYIVGDKGKMYGQPYAHRPIPEARAKELGKPPRKLERSPGHYVEWIRACKGGKPAGSNFVDHAAHLTEVVLLGNIALRTGEKLYWDPSNLRFTNSDKANALINPPYRTGWTL